MAWIPPVWVTWAAMMWALCWSVWACVDSWLRPQRTLTDRIAHTMHLAFCVQWGGFMTAEFFGVWNRSEYLDVVAPYAPVVFFAGPWTIWSVAHWFQRRSVRAETVTMTTVSDSGDGL